MPRIFAASLLSIPLVLGIAAVARADGPIQVSAAFTRAAPAGEHAPVTLTFEKAGKVEVDAVVVKPGGAMPDGHSMDHGMGNMPAMAPAK